MHTPIRIRHMTREDLPFADSVRAEAGWNQTLADWNRFLLHQREGCFIAEASTQTVAQHSNAEIRSPTTSSSEVHPLGSPTDRSEMRAVGTATTWVHGQHLAWIGMVLVLSEARGQGTGTALLQHCIQFLQGRGVRGIRLDATPLGRPVYERLGFRAEWELHRWEHPNWPGLSATHEPPRWLRRLAAETTLLETEQTEPGRLCHLPAPSRFMGPIRFQDLENAPTHGSNPVDNNRIRPWRTIDTHPESPVLALERLALGTPRTQLLEALATTSLQSIVLTDATDSVAAFGMIRSGSRATYLGPAVAQDPASAECVLEALLLQPTGTPLFWDIPEPNWPARAWAEAHGFRRQRVLTRMYLGNPEPAGDPRLQLALSGPETG